VEEATKYSEVEQVEQQRETRPKWFPFSRMGVFYFCVLIGVNAVAAIAMLIMLIPPIMADIISNGGDSYDVIITSVSEQFIGIMPILMLVAYLITIPLCLLIVKRMPVAKDLPKIKWKFSKLLLFLMIAIGVMMFGNLISQALVMVVNLISGQQMSNPVNDILNNDNIIGSIFMTVIIAPFVEEFLFRKVLIDRVRGYGDKITILLSGLIFGLYHGNLFQVIYATLLGMLLAYVYLQTNQIKYCIALHMAVNIIGGVIPLLMYQGIDLDAVQTLQMDELMQIAPRMIMIVLLILVELACMVAAIVVLVVKWKQITLSPPMLVIEKGQSFKVIFLNVGMILLLLSCLAMFIMNAM